MLENLTSEQEQIVEAVTEEYIADITKPTPPDIEVIQKWLDVVYGLYDLKRPQRIEVVGSPYAALKLAADLTGVKRNDTDYCGVADGYWIAQFETYLRLGILKPEEEHDFITLRDFARVAWDTVLLDECAIIIRRPVDFRVDDAGNPHCATGPCLVWADGQHEYAWHGTWVDERVIKNPRGYSREEYLAISNTEQRRALSEAAGWSWVAEILGAKSVDKWTDPKTSLNYDLFRCEDGVQLLSKQSPPLKDGSQPRYLEPVHEQLRTAQAARKWQATSMSPEECEADPELIYGSEA